MGREAPRGGDMCVIMADSHCCTAETNTALEKIKIEKKEGFGHSQHIPLSLQASPIKPKSSQDILY